MRTADARSDRSPDTIFAVASGFGRSALAVIRVSGRETGAALRAMAGGEPPPRVASLRRLVEPASGQPLDQALVLWCPAPHSFTGEDVAELHIHGGSAVRAAVIRALGRMPGCRAAEPGEFTRRAFLNGRMDLAAVEGLADLIDAETEAQRRQALRQLEGALSGKVASWRERLVAGSALLEAGLDFTDEDDVPDDIQRSTAESLLRIRNEILDTLAGARHGERLREGFTVVIAGPPNAGKSTLLNALAKRDVAIVSPHAGTTRDAIEVRCDLDGLPVSFVDTAGLRSTDDLVEGVGVARARQRAQEADLVLWLSAPDAQGEPEPGLETALRVRTKADMGSVEGSAGIAVSAATGDGLADLLAAVTVRAEAALLGSGDAVVTRERHRMALTEVAEALGRGTAVLEAGRDELAAEDVRLALRALGRITGVVDVEEVLDHVFAQFCIGK